MLRRYSLVFSIAIALLISTRLSCSSEEIKTPDLEAVQLETGNTTRRDHDALIALGAAQCDAAALHMTPEEDADVTSGIPRQTQFAARDHFAETSSSEVTISWLGAMFKQRYLNKVEKDLGGAMLRRFILRRSLSDDEIIAAINLHHETTLLDVWCLLSRQPRGGPGVLLTDAAPNVFYVRDIQGKLGAVDVVWGGAGWEIGASELDGRNRWSAGRQVLSR